MSVSTDLASGLPPPSCSLYFQCAATPYSACWCISLRADLDLDGAPAGADDGRVQRLVEVELGGRDVVLEAAGQRCPAGVDRAQHGVAVAHRADEHADADQVVDVVELATAHDHLLVHGVQLLRATHDPAADAQFAQILVDGLDDVLHVLLALRCALLHEALDLGVELRVQHREREILELGLDRLDAEAMRQRSVDLERLGGLLLRLLRRDEAPRAGVVQPVGELDEQHPDVLATSRRSSCGRSRPGRSRRT